jgi:hypothetical protein
VHLRVAGLTIRVTCGERDLRIAPASASARFAVDRSTPDVEIDVVSAPGLDVTPHGECLFDSGGPWRLHRDGTGYLFQFFSSTHPASPYKIARFNSDFSIGQIAVDRSFFASAVSIDPLEYPLDELLVIALLARGKGVEIHACGIVVDESRGYLFVGQSGAGKSTMARLWLAKPGAIVLSDDRVIVRSEEDGIWMYGTPWHGEEPLASPSRGRIAGLFFLRHSDRCELVPVARPDAVARLFAASFPPFHDAAAIEFTLGFLDRVVGGTPCFELGFAIHRDAIEVISAVPGF